jgi:hypothetical protein
MNKRSLMRGESVGEVFEGGVEVLSYAVDGGDAVCVSGELLEFWDKGLGFLNVVFVKAAGGDLFREVVASNGHFLHGGCEGATEGVFDVVHVTLEEHWEEVSDLWFTVDSEVILDAADGVGAAVAAT